MKPPSRIALISDTIPKLYQLSFELNEPYYNFGLHIRWFVRGSLTSTQPRNNMEDVTLFFMIADELSKSSHPATESYDK